MADYFKQEGRYIDIPYCIETGTTITAGSMVWADVSGTNIVHPITSLANSTGFIGVLTAIFYISKTLSSLGGYYGF